jgi:sialic acid synthase SpsE
MKHNTLIIAEIGENHGGDWDLARQMVVAAGDAGADAVKFQSYLGTDVAEDDPERDWFTEVQLPDDMHFELKNLAEAHSMEFLSSCFSLERARFLVEQLGSDEIKVASSEMLNFGLLDYLNERARTVYISTGLATLDEVNEAISHLQDVPDVCILQCTTQYPCPTREANLSVITTLKGAFPQRRVGYSDHTVGSLAPVAAVALGAEVVEKHFTLDKSLPGTDHVLSATPDELSEMVRMIRVVEVLLGNPIKEPTASEQSILEFVRQRFPKDPWKE